MVHRPTLAEVGQQSIVRAIEAHLVGSMVSSCSSSDSESYDGQDVQNIIRERREAENLYYEAMREVGRLEQCLDALKQPSLHLKKRPMWLK